MKRLLWIVVMLVVRFAPFSYADSIQTLQITQVTGSMSPNDGSGDNIFFTFTGPGTSITAFGGMECSPWCSSGYLSPDPSGPIGQVFVNLPFLTATLGGKTYSVDSVGYNCCFFAPFGGDLNKSVILFVGEGDTFKEIKLRLPGGGNWSFVFDFVPPEGDFAGGSEFKHGDFFSSASVVVPEPETLVLLATGFVGIAGMIRRKRPICR